MWIGRQYWFVDMMLIKVSEESDDDYHIKPLEDGNNKYIAKRAILINNEENRQTTYRHR